MSSLIRVLLLLILSVLPLSLSSCEKKETPGPAQPARVSATRAYEHFFGAPPTADKGTCFAFVIYFPSAGEPGKVVPFPFFTFDETSIRKVAVERLLGGMEVNGYKGEFQQLFPPGTRLFALDDRAGKVTVALSREMAGSPGDVSSQKAVSSALALTLGQFPGVKEVWMRIEGEKGETRCAVLPESEAVRQPGPPRLLSVTATKEKGARQVEGVSAYFDRPVNVREIAFSDGSGRPLAGELFHSVFDMAAVLKPRDPGLFKEGTPVKVRWKVTDKTGRMAEGSGEFRLEVKEH